MTSRRRIGLSATLYSIYCAVGLFLTAGRAMMSLADTKGNLAELLDWWNVLRVAGGVSLGTAIIAFASIGGVLLAWDAYRRTPEDRTISLLDHRGNPTEIAKPGTIYRVVLWTSIVAPIGLIFGFLLYVAVNGKGLSNAASSVITAKSADVVMLEGEDKRSIVLLNRGPGTILYHGFQGEWKSIEWNPDLVNPEPTPIPEHTRLIIRLRADVSSKMPFHIFITDTTGEMKTLRGVLSFNVAKNGAFSVSVNPLRSRRGFVRWAEMVPGPWTNLSVRGPGPWAL